MMDTTVLLTASILSSIISYGVRTWCKPIHQNPTGSPVGAVSGIEDDPDWDKARKIALDANNKLLATLNSSSGSFTRSLKYETTLNADLSDFGAEMLSVIRYVNDNNSTTYVVNGSAEARKSKVPYGTIKATDFTFTIGSDGTVTNISNQGYEFTPLEEDVSYSEDDFIKAIQQRTDNNPGTIALISYDLDDLSLGGYSSIRVQYRSTNSSNSLWVYMYSGKVAKFYTSYS